MRRVRFEATDEDVDQRESELVVESLMSTRSRTQLGASLGWLHRFLEELPYLLSETPA